MAAEQKHMISPENVGMWVVTAFIIALLALGVAATSLVRMHNYTLVLETQVLMLNKKIDSLHKGEQQPAEQAAPQE
jgi:hypothetical protein